MAKLTRKSYKRKKIAFAAVILGGVALVSSGFAAWVLSANATGDATGGVTVGEVKDASLGMTITRQSYDFKNYQWKNETVLNGATFCFEPKESDKQGVIASGQSQNHVFNDGENFEQLEIRYAVVVSSTNKSAFKELKVQMTETTKPDSKIPTALNNNWVTAPQCYSADGVTISSKTKTENDEEVNKFKYSENAAGKETKYTWTIIFSDKFSWSTAFGNDNPGNYFDENDAGKKVVLKAKDEPENQKGTSVESILKSMHDTLDKATFNITFTAVAA